MTITQPARLTLRQVRLVKVLERMISDITNDDSLAEMYIDFLDPLFDRLLDSGVFGAWAQGDPRGDQRDGDWSLDRVQGIDE